MTGEPTNIPCARCGAPMLEVEASHLAATVTMRCVFCNQADELPIDDQQRVLAVRQMRQQRRWAEDAARGPALTYVKLLEDGVTMFAPYVFGGFLVAIAALQAGPRALVPVGAVGGIALASWLAVRAGRRRLREDVVPLIRALPGEPGRAQRCRRCGGELPRSASAVVTCSYCDAANLASRSVVAAHHAELAAQVRLGRAYAEETGALVMAAGRHVARLLRLAFFVGAGLGGGLGYLAMRAW